MSAATTVGPVREMALDAALAWEAARLDDVAAGRCTATALIWSCEAALVAPARMRRLPGFELACLRAADAGWPVHLRSTGGDLVPQGTGIVNLTLVFHAPKLAASMLEGSYTRLTTPIREVLADAGISSRHGSVSGAFCDGRFNVTVDGRKFAGTAQRWRPTADGYAVQTHAMILMRSPDETVIAVLNRFYQDCGLDRSIRAGAHVGLNDLVPMEGAQVAQQDFLCALSDRVQEITA